MALTRLDHTGDGTRTVYDLTFKLGYLREEDIYVSLDTNAFTNQLSYSFLNKNQIVLDNPVASGVKFNIRRVVPRDELINDYTSGAILRENNLDDSFLQPLMIMEEIRDGYTAALIDDDTLTTIFGDVNIWGALQLDGILDMQDHRIVRLANPEGPYDAVNVQSVDQVVSTFLGSFNPELYLDYGLITEDVGDELDYGSL